MKRLVAPDPHSQQRTHTAAQRRQQKQRLLRHPAGALVLLFIFCLELVKAKHQKRHQIDQCQPQPQQRPWRACPDPRPHNIVSRLRHPSHLFLILSTVYRILGKGQSFFPYPVQQNPPFHRLNKYGKSCAELLRSSPCLRDMAREHAGVFLIAPPMALEWRI